MRDISFKPQGVCSVNLTFQLDDENKIHNVQFTGGCNGNLKAIGKLVEGRDAAEVKDILKGNQCGPRQTSCADQFAKQLNRHLLNRKFNL